MKTVLITGSSSGVGFATALSFAREGYCVIATMRNLEKSDLLQIAIKTENLSIDIRQLDITNEHSIQKIVKNVLEDYAAIDILINNAGSGFLGTLEQTSLSDAQNVMDVNFFGVWRLTQAVLPSMRQNKQGHIISITSVGGVIGQPFNEAYCAAKFAVEGLMESLAPVVKRFSVSVSLVEPGPIHSDFIESTLKKSPSLDIDLVKDYQSMFDSYSEATKNAFLQFGQTPDEIAKVLLKIAKSENPDFRYQTSDISKKIAKIKFSDPTGNEIIALSGSRLPEKV